MYIKIKGKNIESLDCVSFVTIWQLEIQCKHVQRADKLWCSLCCHRHCHCHCHVHLLEFVIWFVVSVETLFWDYFSVSRIIQCCSFGWNWLNCCSIATIAPKYWYFDRWVHSHLWSNWWSKCGSAVLCFFYWCHCWCGKCRYTQLSYGLDFRWCEYP